MPAELTLILTQENGQEQPIAVTANPFSLGRGEGNDLVVNDSGISRRHALITFFNDVAQVTDCGSANGTLVNGKQISGNENLRDGDILTLGENCKMRVQLKTANAHLVTPAINSPPSVSASAVLPSRSTIARHSATPTSSAGFKLPQFSPLMLAGAAVGAIVLISIIGITFVALKQKNQLTKQTPIDLNAQAANITNTAENSATALPVTSANESLPAVASNDPFEKNAIQVIRKISDDSTYPFTPKMLDEIKRRASQLDAGNIRNVAKAMETRGQAVANEARNQGIRPELVFYLGLAETNGGQSGDPLNAARQIIPEINFLRAHFGTGQADYALLVIAATKIPGGNKKSHPLLGCMRNKVKNPQTDRNIWFLHEAGCLSDSAYEFVLKFLACGILAQ